MVPQRKKKKINKGASNAVRAAGPVRSIARIGIMSVCCGGNIYLQCRM